MIKPVTMCAWRYDEEKKETVKEVKGYLLGVFDERGFLTGFSPPFMFNSPPVTTPELAMEMPSHPTEAPRYYA